MIEVHDLAPEQVFMSVRAKGTADRKEKVNELITKVGSWLEAKGVMNGRVRIELFEPTQQAAARWGPPAEASFAASPACWCGLLNFLRKAPSSKKIPPADS